MIPTAVMITREKDTESGGIKKEVDPGNHPKRIAKVVTVERNHPKRRKEEEGTTPRNSDIMYSFYTQTKHSIL